MKQATQERLSQTLKEELNAAAMTASLSSGNARHVRIGESDLPSLIPSRSLLKVSPVKFGELKMGDLICVRMGNNIVVRRYIKSRITKSSALLLAAREGSTSKDEVRRACFLGKIEAVNAGKKSYDPTAKEGALRRFWGKFTEYGTHKPFGGLISA